jgi:hypothetical protein
MLLRAKEQIGGRGVAQVVECLPSNREALGSNPMVVPVPPKKKKKTGTNCNNKRSEKHAMFLNGKT